MRSVKGISREQITITDMVGCGGEADMLTAARRRK